MVLNTKGSGRTANIMDMVHAHMIHTSRAFAFADDWHGLYRKVDWQGQKFV